MIAKLVLKSIRREKIRFLVAVCGVAAAAGMLVWSLGLTMTAVNQSAVQAEEMTAPFTCWLTTAGVGAQAGGRVRPRSGPPIPPELLAKVRALPAVQTVCPLRVLHFPLDYRPGGKILQGPGLHAAVACAPDSGYPLTGKVEGRWPEASAAENEVAVCVSQFAYGEATSLPPLGAPLVFITPAGTVTAKITALIHGKKPLPGFPTAYGNAALFNHLAAAQASPSVRPPAANAPDLLLCKTAAPADTAAVQAAVNEFMAGRPAEAPGHCEVYARADIIPLLTSDSLNNFKRQAPLLLTLSLLTALCMLVNSLIVGVEQQMRELALLRAAGMTVRQMLRLVITEGLLTAFCGWVLGMLGGWAAVVLFTAGMPETFPAGAALGWLTPAASLAAVTAAALLSLLWPCLRAARIRPLDVLAARREFGKKISRRRTVIGFILLLPMLALGLPLPLPPLTHSILLFALGIPLHVIGLFMFLPFFITAFERLCGRGVSMLTGLDPRLSQRRLSRNFIRTAGMVLTIGVGLGTFTAIHIWGGTLMAAFIPSRSFPEIIVSALPNGFSRADAGKIAEVDGIAGKQALEMEAAQFYFTDAFRERAARHSGRALRNDYNLLLIGVDFAALCGGDAPLADFVFVAGSRETAVNALSAPNSRACVITAMLAREAGVQAGDFIEFLPNGAAVRQPRRGGKGGGKIRGQSGKTQEARPAAAAAPAPCKLQIAGIIDANWHLISSRARLRGRNGMPGGTSGPVFVREDLARELTGNRERTYYLWFNLTEDYRALGELPAGQQIDANIRKALPGAAANSLRVHHRDEISDGTIAHGAAIIGDMARAPFWSLIVLSSGIITLLIASFQASAREIAVMRAVGLTRSQLFRLLLGEALLTGGCGAALSLFSGMAIGWTFTGVTRAWMPWGGLPFAPAVPWGVLAEGVGFTLGLCLLMAAPVIVWLARRQDENKGLAMR